MDLQLEIKVDDFNAAMAEMHRRLGNSAPKKAIIQHEVGRILERTLAKTSVATKASINDSVKRKEWTTYPAQWNGGGGKRYKLSNRYPNALWAKIQAQQAASIARKVAAIGWARKSWYALGILIGQPINARGADRATVPGRQATDNVAVKAEDSGGNYVLKVENWSPLMRWTDGRKAFFAAIAGRIGFFRRNLAHGVFNDLKAVQAKYPGIRIETPQV